MLYPKYLLGGVLARGQGASGEGSDQGGVAGQIRGLVGRWPQVDADTLLEQGGMSEGLRDWDLWYVHTPSRGMRSILTIVLSIGDHCYSACCCRSSCRSMREKTSDLKSSAESLLSSGLVRPL